MTWRRKQASSSRMHKEFQIKLTQRYPQDRLSLKCQNLKIGRIIKHQEKNSLYLQGKPHRTVGRFLSRNFTGQKGMTCYPKCEKQENFNKHTLPREVIIQN